MIQEGTLLIETDGARVGQVNGLSVLEIGGYAFGKPVRITASAALGKAGARQEAIQLTRQRLAGMEEFMEVTNKIFQQFVGNAKSGLNRVAKVLLKAL